MFFSPHRIRKHLSLSAPLFPALILLVVLLCGAQNAWAQPRVTGIALAQQPGGLSLTISSSEPFTSKRAFLLDNPLRLVLDISRVSNQTVVMPKLPAASAVKGLRFGQFSESASRFVIEMNATVASYHLQTFMAARGQPNRLVLHIKTKGGNKPYREVLISADSPATAKAASKPEKTLSRQRVRKPMIVIDAGHGGKDPGAIASNKVMEKTITLSYALALKKALLQTGRYRVTLTRSDDTFIYLHERVKKAREAGGDLMISIHADSASQRSARGLSIYTVSEKASDAEASLLARQENAVDKIGGIQFADDHPEIADILIDLASRDTRIKSTDLSTTLLTSLKAAGIPLLRFPNRYAGFLVLKSPDVPSVLIEVGFLSNRQDEALLQNAAHREKFATAIIEGIDRYIAKHPPVARVK
jgi:N-acetylmuramoyl-L-alanine amidase